MKVAEKEYMGLVAQLGCCVCKRLNGAIVKPELHHVAEGTSKRSNYAVVPLCPDHHRGGAGFHTLGTKRFCSLYRVPWEREEGLLVWTAEDLHARYESVNRFR